MLCSTESIFPLIDCFQAAISRLGPDFGGGELANDHRMVSSTSGDNEYKNLKTGEKRLALDLGCSHPKRQKIVDEREDFSTNCQGVDNISSKFTCVGEREYADYMCTSLSLFVEDLTPPCVKDNSLKPEVALAALTALCIVFCEYPHLNLTLSIFSQFCKWIPWISEQVC